MEAIGVITAVCTLVQGIGNWLEERAEKESIIKELRTTVSQVQNILFPLQAKHPQVHIEGHTLDCIKAIGDVLKRTQEHLLVWECRRSRRIFAFISPSTAINQLKDDGSRLNQQLMLLLTSMTIVEFVNHQQLESRKPIKRLNNKKPAEPSVLDSIKNREVRDFWGNYIGATVSFVPSGTFRLRLSAWTGSEIGISTGEKLLQRLDEFGTGGVTPSNLDNMAGRNSLREMVRQYTQIHPVRGTAQLNMPPQESQHIQLPLLIWVDDNPQNNSWAVSIAHKSGLNVIQLTSTALAKAWIEANNKFLIWADSHSLIRFISDNYRDEPSSAPYLNLTAGENILRYLRGRQFTAPVLIFCGESIGTTQYVLNYSNAGSTTFHSTCSGYITAFAGRSKDDGKWVGFNTGWS